ncbi:MAG TPA: UDP-N-acetylmuramate--L-alanine ligase [Thermomicrobiales bacterium]|nr:UDP-N-acetylmuramate--L-alanine ligase [Thermomicrobiales bacterium]
MVTGQLPSPPARVHMVGIGGVGVSGLARMLHSRGYVVTGSDMSSSPIVQDLTDEGISVRVGHRAENVGDADLVIATAAAREDNPELVEARRRNIPVVKRAAALGMLANPATCLAVAGSHGKSTTSGMAAFAFERAGLEPSFAVGATVGGLGTNARLGDGPHFIVEADEYDYSFLWLEPAVAIVTNVEHDHPDIFPALDDVINAFERFAGNLRAGGTLVISSEDTGAQLLTDRLRSQDDLNVVTYGFGGGDWQIVRYSAETSTLRDPSGQMFELRLAVPGRHNVGNALAVLAAGSSLGIEPGDLIPGLEAFSGVGRRFEVLLDQPRRTVIDDYAHHPTEIAVNIAAARERYPDRRLLVIFQPHTYSRTHALLGDFARALDGADRAIVAEIYPAREVNTLGVFSADIVALMDTGATVAESPDDAGRIAQEIAQDGDVILVMGAGDIYQTSKALAAVDDRAQ